MTYITISDSSQPFVNYLQKCVHPYHKNLINRYVTSSCALLGLAATNFTIHLTDTILGSLLATGVLLSGGKFPKLDFYAQKHLRKIEGLLSLTYLALIKIVSFPGIHRTTIVDRIQKKITSFYKPQIEKLHSSTNFFKREIVTRLSDLLKIIAISVTTVAITCFGLVTAAFSFILLGKSRSINTLAFNSLEAPKNLYELYPLSVAFVSRKLFVKLFPQ